jgi:hypothetical protein
MNIKAIEKGSFTLIVDDNEAVYMRTTTSDGNINWFMLDSSDLISQWQNHDQLEEDYYDSL